MLGKREKTMLQWGLVIAIMAVLVYVGDVSDLVRLPALHLPSLLFVFLSMVLFTLVHNLRWTAIIKSISSSPQNKKCDFFQCYQWLMNSYVLGTVIPSDISLAGVRTFYIDRSQILPLPVALFSVLIDRFFDFVIFLLLAVPAGLLITGAMAETESLFLAGIIFIAFFLFASQKQGRRIMGIYRFGMDRLLGLPVLGRRIREKWGDAISRTSFDEGTLSRMMGWSLLKYLLMAGRFYFTGQALGVDFSLLQSIFFIPFIQLVAMLNITPGGLGVVEAGSYGALKLMGVPEPRIMVFVVGQRILTYGVTIAIALISYLLLTFHLKIRKARTRS